MDIEEEKRLDQEAGDSVAVALWLITGFVFAWIPFAALLKSLGLDEQTATRVWDVFFHLIYIPGYLIVAVTIHRWMGKGWWNYRTTGPSSG